MFLLLFPRTQRFHWLFQDGGVDLPDERRGWSSPGRGPGPLRTDQVSLLSKRSLTDETEVFHLHYHFSFTKQIWFWTRYFLFSLKIYEEILCLKLKWFIIFSKTTFTSKYYFTTVRIVSFLLFLQFSLMFSLVCVLPPEPPHLVSYRNYLQRIEVSESRITSVRSPVATLFP